MSDPLSYLRVTRLPTSTAPSTLVTTSLSSRSKECIFFSPVMTSIFLPERKTVTVPSGVWVVDSDFFSTVPGDWLHAAATTRRAAEARNAS